LIVVVTQIISRGVVTEAAVFEFVSVGWSLKISMRTWDHGHRPTSPWIAKIMIKGITKEIVVGPLPNNRQITGEDYAVQKRF
jgi:hypothetical protein